MCVEGWGGRCVGPDVLACSFLPPPPIAAEQEPVLWLHPGRFCVPEASGGSASPSALLGEAAPPAQGWAQLCCALGSPAPVLPR